MISLQLYRTLLCYACLMGVTSFGLVWSIYISRSWLAGISLLLLLVLIIYALAHYLNATNRKIAFFFEAIENEDSALIFPEEKNTPILTALHHGLHKLNTAIQKIKIEHKTQEQYYNKIFDQVSTAILTKDERGFIFLANSSCKQLINRKNLTHIRQVAGFSPKLHRVLEKIQPHERQLINLSLEGKPRHLLLHTSGFRTQSQDLTIITIQDIKNELDARELDSWIKLISVLTHEIINTISPVTSLSESIYERFKEQQTKQETIPVSRQVYEKTLEGLEVIKERGRGLIGFVDSYRRLTKLPRPEKRTLSLEELINKIKILVSREANFDQVVFRQKIIPGDLEIFADEKLIVQALINILKNAIEALRGHQDATIQIIAGIAPTGKVEITISDNGPGIPPEILDDIFTPFFTTKTSGTGIGLTLSRQILRLHGGTLNVRTAPGKGTSLIMTL